MNLGTRIRERRKRLGLTLKEVSAYVGVAEATVQRWESGNIKMLKSDKMIKLSSALQISVEELSSWVSGHAEPGGYDLSERNIICHTERLQSETDLLKMLPCHQAVHFLFGQDPVQTRHGMIRAQDIPEHRYQCNNSHQTKEK